MSFSLAFALMCGSCWAVAQADPSYIVNRKFTGYELREFLKKSPVTHLYFESCTVTKTPGEFTETGFDNMTLLVPSNIQSLQFALSSFHDVELTIEDHHTSVAFERCTTTNFHLKPGAFTDLISTNVTSFQIDGNSGRTDTLSIIVSRSNIDRLFVADAVIEAFSMEQSVCRNITLSNISFSRYLWDKRTSFYPEEKYPFFGQVSVDSVTMTEMKRYMLWGNRSIFLNYSFNGLVLIDNQIGTLSLSNCRFTEKEEAVVPLYHNSIDDLLVAHSRFGTIDLFSTEIKKNLIFENSTVRGLNLFLCELPHANVSGLQFNVLSGHKLYVFDPLNIQTFSSVLPNNMGSDSLLTVKRSYEDVVDTVWFKHVIPYKAVTNDAIENNYLFSELINCYNKLYKVYKERGDLQSANECYAEMKDLATKQLHVQYSGDPSLKRFFRWQLANIVRIYTNHGTDPALAIVISFWVVVVFAVFYFFFPSDWDTSSKAKLIEDYSIFIQKNDKGYFFPFLKLARGFLLSFMNALTLSLNAYTTLGFGNIPTHGIARYACVLEGFIGWFMLSIFTVALINQVLF